MINYLINVVYALFNRLMKLRPIRLFSERYPVVFNFFIHRFSVKIFTGLPLTMLATALLANLMLIMDFTPDVINSKEFVVADRQVAQWLYLLRTPVLAAAFSWLTLLCNIEFVIALSALAAIIFIVKRKFDCLVAMLIALAGCGITIYVSKNIFQIDRPFQMAYTYEYSFSFPSGHATIAVALYGSLFYFLVRNTASLKLRFWVFNLALAFALLIGFSRLYLCVHYLSDVLGGYMLGSVWLILSISVFEWMRYSKNRIAL